MPRHLLSTDGLDSFDEVDLAADPVALSSGDVALTLDGTTIKRGTLPATGAADAVPGAIDDAYIGGVLYIAHRGGPNVYPEHTMEAYRAVVAAGAKAIEQDCYLLADGSLGVMHDATVDRTTSSSGNTADQTVASWQALTVDIGSTLGGAYDGTTLDAPLFDDVVREFGNKVLLCPEAKNTGSGAAIVAVLQRYGVATDAALVQSFTSAELAAARAAGYPTMHLGNALTPSTVVANGDEWVGCSSSASQAYVESMVSAGLKVAVYTVDRHYLRDLFIGYGATGFYSDDPIYLAEQHIKTNDPFAAQTWAHGMLQVQDRGEFFSPDAFGWSSTTLNYLATLQGWACPVGGDPGNDSWEMSFTVQFDSESSGGRWAAVWVADDDYPYDDDTHVSQDNGYHFLMRKDGRVQIYRVNGGAVSQLASTNGTAISDGASADYTLTITPTSLTLERTDVLTTVNSSDTTHRGGYFQFARNGAAVRFSDVVITDT